MKALPDRSRWVFPLAIPFIALAMSCGGSSSKTDAARDAADGGAEVRLDAPSGTESDVVRDAPADSPCTGGQILVYSSPGCGVSAPTPVCAGPTFDACANPACACTGAQISGCGQYTEPFAHLGPCADAGSPADTAADTADASDVRADTSAAPDVADVPADAPDAPAGGTDAPADAPDAPPDVPVETGPACTLGTAANCAACGDPACTLANTLTACTSADQCGRAVCTWGFGNCNASSPDCETSFAAGGTCLPRHRGTSAFPTGAVFWTKTAIGTDGSIFLIGSFWGSVDFDPSSAQDVHAPDVLGENAAFVTKLNADGSYAWTRTLSDPGVSFEGLAAAPNGAVVATGSFLGTVDLDPGPGMDLHQASENPNNGRQTLVVKLAADGSLVWGRTFREATTYRSYSNGGAAAVDATGAVYLAGVFTSEVDFDPGPASVVRAAPLVGGAWVVKLTAAGDFSWVQTISGGDICTTRPSSLAIATDGKIWAVGSIGFGSRCEGLPSTTDESGREPLIAVYSPEGDARGRWVLPPPLGVPTSASAVTAGPNGSVYIGGSAGGLIDLDPGPGVATRWAGPWESGFVVKLAADASLLWAMPIPGAPVSGVAAATDGGVLLAANRPAASADQGLTAVVGKLGADGTPSWTFATASPGATADGVAARGNTFVVAGGTERGPGDYDPGPGTQIIDGQFRFLSIFDY